MLEPGELLSIGFGQRQMDFGDGAEGPLGGMAALVWLQVDGEEWASHGLRFKCTGELDGLLCSRRGGHGRVDLGKALEQECRLAFLAWARWSVKRWTEESGEGGARARLVEAFRPFLGHRMPPGGALPPLGLEWVGEGALLRANPKSLLQWMLDPVNAGLSERAIRLLRPIGSLFSKPGQDWWFTTGSMPGADPAAPVTWVAGSDGQRYAVLRFSTGRTQSAALARMKVLVGISRGNKN